MGSWDVIFFKLMQARICSIPDFSARRVCNTQEIKMPELENGAHRGVGVGKPKADCRQFITTPTGT